MEEVIGGLVNQIHKSKSKNKTAWQAIYDNITAISEKPHYKVFESRRIMQTWLNSLDWTKIVGFDGIRTQQMCESYVEQYPYTMMINDEFTEPESGS